MKLGDLLRKLQGNSLAFDSRFLLYHLEPDSRFEPVTSALLRLVESGKSRASASILVLHDLYLRLALSKDRDAVATCQAVLLNFPNLRFVSIDEQIVADAAYLQSKHGLDAWIALHLSCARNDGAKFFVTATSGLPPVPEIETVSLESIHS